MTDMLDTFDNLIDDIAGNLPDSESETSHDHDAIDDILEDKPRETKVTDLKNHPDIVSFREALSEGLLTADTVIRFLQLLQAILSRWIP